MNIGQPLRKPSSNKELLDFKNYCNLIDIVNILRTWQTSYPVCLTNTGTSMSLRVASKGGGTSGSSSTLPKYTFYLRSINNEATEETDDEPAHAEHTVTFNGGLILHGTNVIEVEDADVTVDSGTEDNPSYAYVDYDLDDHTAVIAEAASVDLLAITPTPSSWRCPLCSFYLDEESNIYSKNIHQIGDIHLPLVLG